MREALTFDDVLMVPNYCGFESRKEVSTSVKLGPYDFSIPVISSNMDTITGSEMARRMCELGGLGILHRFCSIEDNVKMFKDAVEWSYHDAEYHCHVGVSVGVNEGMDRANALYAAGARIFCVDVAHGHSKLVNQMIKQLKELPDVFVIAGNVATYAGADYLAGCGADAIKVGIGPGSVCTTRIKTGMGVPQLTAIMDCAKCSKPIIADGGCRTPGDVAKALAAGARMVMLGGMLAGTDETPGEMRQVGPPDIMVKSFRGMASREAVEDFFGNMDDWKTAEGVAVEIPYKGPVEHVIKDVIGGLRSCMTYAGAATLEELTRRVEFVKITQAGRIESNAHIKT
jgi:IMP dehydrogenase